MTRAVRISPLPIPAPAATVSERPRTYGTVGAVLFLVGLLCYATHVVLAGSGSHAWDRHAVPPAQITVTRGATYLISTAAGPGAPPAATPLSCSYRLAGAGNLAPLAVAPVTVSSRATHAVASFGAPVSGQVSVTCSGGVVGAQPVFVDDADDAPADLGGATLLLAVLLLLTGGGAMAGAAYRRAPSGSTRAPVSGVTT